MANDEITVLEGNLNAAGLKIAVVCARFNEFFVSKLFSGAVDAIVRHGGDRANITQAWVPGSFELPFAVSQFAKSGSYDAVIALGVVIQGATAHASTIYSQVSKSLAQIGMDSGAYATLMAARGRHSANPADLGRRIMANRNPNYK